MPIDAMANRIMLWDGGIITPWQDEVTVTATEKSLSESVIIGIRMEPMDEVSATAEPEMPPKTAIRTWSMDSLTLIRSARGRAPPQKLLFRAEIAQNRRKKPPDFSGGHAVWQI